MTRAKRDPVMAIKEGLRKLGLRYFPDLKYRDIRNSKRVTWDFKSFVELHPDSLQPSSDAAAAGMVGNICSEIEQRALTFRRNLEVYKEHGMPWLAPVIDRIPLSMPQTKVFKILVFVSCVALLQNGCYISYLEMKQLMDDMEVNQTKLQALHIQGKAMLKRVSTYTVLRLHDSIPTKLVEQKPIVKALWAHEDPPAEVEEDVQLLQIDEICENVPPTSSTCLPVTKGTHWTAQEMDIVCLDKSVSNKEAFKLYVGQCAALHISVRTFRSFETKRRRMMS